MTLKWGYYTASGYLSSTMQDLYVASYESRSVGERRALRIHLEGNWELLARSRQRGQFVYATDYYSTILTRIFQRAGITLSLSANSSRSGSTIPALTIAADTDAATAARRALSYLADRIRMGASALATMTEPLASAATTYTFGGAHGIFELVVAVDAAASTEIAVTGAAVWGESLDYANAGQGVGTREQVRDISSVSGAAATNTAIARQRQRALDAHGGRLVCPPHVGAELLDVIDFTDAWISGSATKRRVQGIRWRYDRHRAIYEQTLTLGAA